jgi:hypothetical protein
MNAPFTLVRDDHYIVVTEHKQGERVSFGAFLPLTKKAAGQFARQYGGRVIKRTTARKSGLI